MEGGLCELWRQSRPPRASYRRQGRRDRRLLRPGGQGREPNPPNGLNPREHIFDSDRVTGDPLYLPIDVLKAFEAGCGNAVYFLTEDVAAIQLEALAALMDDRKCESLSFF